MVLLDWNECLKEIMGLRDEKMMLCKYEPIWVLLLLNDEIWKFWDLCLDMQFMISHLNAMSNLIWVLKGSL